MPVPAKFDRYMGFPKVQIYAREAWFWNGYRYREDWIFPLHTCNRTIFGASVQCPANETAILRYIFGEDFMSGRTLGESLMY